MLDPVTTDERSSAATPELHPPLPVEPTVRAESVFHGAPGHGALARMQQAVRFTIASRRGQPAWVLMVVLFIGVGWLRAAVEKIVDPAWWNGTVLNDFIANHATLTLPWYRGFVDVVIAPNVLLISIVVVIAQLAVAVTLLAGRYVVPGLLIGMFLNLNFVAAGAVNPSIFYLVCQAALILWMVQHGSSVGVPMDALRWITTASVGLFLITAPFMRSFDPAAAVEDPAMVLAFLSLVMTASIRLSLQDPTSTTAVDA